jgi:sec-independent protein translocase protein TatB
MLDFGFSEILLTSAIALVVLGPERLPKVARQVGNWMGRARVMARQLGEQLEREVSAEEFLKEQNKTAANRLMVPSSGSTSQAAAPQFPIPHATPAEFAPGHHPAPDAALSAAAAATTPLASATVQSVPVQPVATVPAVIPAASEPSSAADGGATSRPHE